MLEPCSLDENYFKCFLVLSGFLCFFDFFGVFIPSIKHYKWLIVTDQYFHIITVTIYLNRAMINENKSNAILVSGESGAGKTETTKMLMRYLAYLGGRAATEGRTVEQQVLEVKHPVFGLTSLLYCYIIYTSVEHVLFILVPAVKSSS